ncbi:hypothetical protein [Streptomyces cathayae]|uniref:Uncharacterized protein n=1 Tax=Streptomyces cathayae TaxID=3031124 RepID=A0ABY8K9A6_9ACTN|nr:hypothetical protein [Streptomyces sp. HUAS 5]WGD43048.1 hypothetical protein PYS65_24525 [Streptomyces sp. HUAS 5]
MSGLFRPAIEVEHVGCLLFLELDHERSQRPGRFARKSVVSEDTWPKLTDLSGDASYGGITTLMRKLGAQAPTRSDRRIADLLDSEATQFREVAEALP